MSLKRISLYAIAAVYCISSLWWGPMAEAAFHLDYAPGVAKDDGMAIPVEREVVYQLPPKSVAKKAVVPTRTRRAAGDFWRRLANCESPSGKSGHFRGYFQFSPDTAAKVGIDGSESYEEQRAAAQRWASQVNPGSTAGWPTCWPIAQRGG